MATSTVLLRPLASVGSFVFDCEIGGQQGDVRDYSARRIPTGETVIDHSILNPEGKVFTLTGRISALPQPQNFGRKSPAVSSVSVRSLQSVATQLLGVTSRITDLLSDLSGLMAVGDEVEVITKIWGKVTAVITSWSESRSGPTAGGGAEVTMSLLVISRAVGLNFINPNLLGSTSNGSGSTTDLGPTSLVPQTINVQP